MENNIQPYDLLNELKTNFTEHGFFNLERLVHNVQPIGKEDNLTYFDGSWKYVIQLDLLRKGKDMRSQRVGSFFIKALHNNVRMHSQIAKDLDEIFLLPNSEVSLMNIVQLYATLNSDLLSFNNLYGETDPAVLMETIPEFVSCFDAAYEPMDIGSSLSYIGLYDDKILNTMNHSNVVLPCVKKQYESKCKNYCNWHSKYFNGGHKEEFLTTMKYSLPQPKIKFNSYSDQEKKMAQIIFGVSNVGNLSHPLAPNAAAVFCFSKIYGYSGVDIGMSAKVCNDFKQVPSDMGISISNRLKLQTILKIGKPYEAFFELDMEENGQELMEGGNFWTQQTFVINTGIHDHFAKFVDNAEPEFGIDYRRLENIKIQLHHSKELAHFRNDSHFDKSLVPLDLKAGYSYTIDITPIGQVSSEEFKRQSFKQRNCFLEYEGLEESIFNAYSENNCKYECHVKLARKVCKCQPWDYFAQGMEEFSECDVFGRKCFVEQMKSLAQFPKAFCPDCKKACDYLEYQREIIKVEKIHDEFGLVGKYYTSAAGRAIGSRAIIDFVEDNDEIFYDSGLKNSSKRSRGERIDGVYNSLIFVHLRFLDPKVNEITPKYTVGDMIGNFGGQFGLFEQVTGASFLGLLNLLILLFKLMFSPFRRE